MTNESEIKTTGKNKIQEIITTEFEIIMNKELYENNYIAIDLYESMEEKLLKKLRILNNKEESKYI